jgi:MFS family permease
MSRRVMADKTFRSLHNRNYPLYFFGQLASVTGTFMQNAAQAWLVLKLTHSGTALGLVVALQYLPILLFSGYCGVLADRFDRRRLFTLTQIAATAEASLLATLVFTHSLHVWMIYALAFVLGLISSLEQPSKQAMIYDIVGPADLENAVSLNMSLQNGGRITGPAAAGVLIAAFGVGICFAVNAGSFAFVLLALLLMDPSRMEQRERPARSRGQFRDGVRQVRDDPRLATLLGTSAVLFGLAWEFEIVVPLVAQFTFHGSARTFGALIASQGAGAVVGGLFAARRAGQGRSSLPRRAFAFGSAMLAAAAAPTLVFEYVALVACGFTGISLVAALSARVQLAVPAEIRGRVLALWIVCTVGVRPIGGPIVGLVGQRLGPRFSLGLGAAVAFLVVPVWLVTGNRIRRSEREEAAVTIGVEVALTEM